MRKMVKLGKRAAWYGLVLAVLAAVAMSSMAFYFVYYDAPILQGKIEYKVNYHDDKALDIYYPLKQVREKIPVILYIHGGAWISGTKEAINFNRYHKAINVLRNQGYAIVAPNYTLAKNGQSPFPHCIQDAFIAADWIVQNADKYSFDLDNVGLLGESAGAHLALMIASSHPTDFDLQLDPIDFRYVIDVYGPCNLEGLYHMQSMDSLSSVLARLPQKLEDRLDIRNYLFGFDPAVDSLRAYEFMEVHSPVRYINENTPPVLMIHGDKDLVVPVDQSILLKSVLDELNVKNELHILPKVGHAFRGITKAQKESMQIWIQSFVTEHTLKKGNS